MAKDKTISVRCDEATEQRFSLLAEQSGLPKAALLPEMMKLWETQQLKLRVPGRADDIDAFNAGIKQLTNLYIASVDGAVLAKAAAKAEWQVEEESYRKEVALLLKKQDELQEMNVAQAKELQELREENARLVKENETLKNTVEEKEDTLSEIRELKEFVKMLRESKVESGPTSSSV